MDKGPIERGSDRPILPRFIKIGPFSSNRVL